MGSENAIRVSKAMNNSFSPGASGSRMRRLILSIAAFDWRIRLRPLRVIDSVFKRLSCGAP
jgi:hypothetical protein